jgi:hypothetical protein
VRPVRIVVIAAILTQHLLTQRRRQNGRILLWPEVLDDPLDRLADTRAVHFLNSRRGDAGRRRPGKLDGTSMKRYLSRAAAAVLFLALASTAHTEAVTDWNANLSTALRASGLAADALPRPSAIVQA